MERLDMGTISPSVHVSRPYDEVIAFILDMMNNTTKDLSEKISISQVCHSMGIETEMIKQIEAIASNPFNQLIKQRTQLDTLLWATIHASVKDYLLSNSNLLEGAYLTETGNSKSLYYSIVLKDDNYETRTEIFSYLRDYNSEDVSDLCPVSFQIVPKSVASRIKVKESVL